jgi:hypothetical protein
MENVVLVPGHKCFTRVVTHQPKLLVLTEILGNPVFCLPSIGFLPKVLATFVNAHHQRCNGSEIAVARKLRLTSAKSGLD